MYLIIQTGDPVQPALRQFGRFDTWFITAMSVRPDQAVVVDVYSGQTLPSVAQAAETFKGILITGSPSMVTDQHLWVLETQHWLQQIMAFKIPVLGVCFGHQLLADMLGGQVDYNAKGRNLGLSEFEFSPSARHDPLLLKVSDLQSMPTFASHSQHIKTLPKTATRLGSCQLDENHAFVAEEVIWGLQFHPEWNQQITQTYIDARYDDLVAEHLNPVQMKQSLKPCDAAYGLLARFVELTQ